MSRLCLLLKHLPPIDVQIHDLTLPQEVLDQEKIIF